MKLKFDSKLAFQLEAIQSITEIFEGQETCKTNFSVTKATISKDQFTIPDEKIGVVKTNAMGIMKRYGIEEVRSI
jgi:type III restriction enzyme